MKLTNKEDLIKRNLAIAYATSGLVRRIDGEEWIRTSDFRIHGRMLERMVKILRNGRFE